MEISTSILCSDIDYSLYRTDSVSSDISMSVPCWGIKLSLLKALSFIKLNNWHLQTPNLQENVGIKTRALPCMDHQPVNISITFNPDFSTLPTQTKTIHQSKLNRVGKTFIRLSSLDRLSDIYSALYKGWIGWDKSGSENSLSVVIFWSLVRHRIPSATKKRNWKVLEEIGEFFIFLRWFIRIGPSNSTKVALSSCHNSNSRFVKFNESGCICLPQVHKSNFFSMDFSHCERASILRLSVMQNHIIFVFVHLSNSPTLIQTK
jgi:hypothetical protein